MEEEYRNIISLLTKEKRTIATMESCTGGGVANMITNIEGASEVLKFSAVTYSNEFKEKMGVSKRTIDTFTVYSIEVAREMAYHISEFANSDYGIGITGKLNRIDQENPYGRDNIVFVSIYEKGNDSYTDLEIEVMGSTREENKDLVIQRVGNALLRLLTE